MSDFDSVKNLAKVSLSTGYSSSDTTLVLTSGGGLLLPTPPFNATWWNGTDYGDPADDPNVEIVRVTSIAGDTLTVRRAQESTTVSSKNTASKTYYLIAGLTALTMATVSAAFVDAQEAITELQEAVSLLAKTLVLQGFDVPDALLAYVD